MKKVIIVLIVLVAVGVIGLNFKDSPKSQTSQPAQQTMTIDRIAQSMGATNKTEAYYSLIGAKDGAKYTLGDSVVEVYQFAPDKLADGVKQLSNEGTQVRETSNFVVVFHDITAAQADQDMKEIK